MVTFADKTNLTFNHHNDIDKKLRLSKFRYFVDLRNRVFAHDYFKIALPESFTEFFTLSSNTHSHNTRTSIKGTSHVSRTNSVKFGSNSLKSKSISACNNIVIKFSHIDMINLKRKKNSSLRAMNF